MSLVVHRAPRTDQLADAVGELLSWPLDDPFAEDVVVVPARGVERWLTQRLSHRLGVGGRGGDGVCAGVRFLRPGSLVAMILDKDDDDPWAPDRLVWPLLATIDDGLAEAWCAPLARHLGEQLDGDAREIRRARRYSVAIRLAHLFASYAVQRPQLITDWRAGRATDGVGGDLDADLAWQPELWRRVLDRIPADPPDVRHAQTLQRLRSGDAGLDLPDRLSLFGHTRIPVTEVELLKALGEHRDVHLWLPQPSPALWEALDGGGVVPRDDDSSAELVDHPLLASLGRDSRELRGLLADVPDEEAGSRDARRARSSTAAGGRGGRASDRHETEGADTLLGWLQDDIRNNHSPTSDERAARHHDPGDRSLQVHACHGAARQVDVLREVLVGLLEADPTLEPRDILVMCPDIETYAPLISAGFGLAASDRPRGDEPEHPGHPAHQLRVRLADRALTSTNPLLHASRMLLHLSGGRVTASEVLDLAASDPVRRRFGFTDDELDRVHRWVAEAGVRWGVDTATRAAFSMDKFEHNTWRAGIDRILLGVAMSGDDHRCLGRGLPLDDVGSSEIDLAGRLAELVDRLAACLEGLDRAATVAEWTQHLRDGVRALTDVDRDDSWQVPQFERELARVQRDATTAFDGGADETGLELRLADVRALLDSRLAGRPTRANFRTGTLTVCTMVPMRSVPHRVVCLVGLDDGAFPRVGSIDGDDVLLRQPLTGERDARSEDRQLLLDALLAASEHVVITYTGANEHTGARRPPAVPLGEILDAADRTTAEPVRRRILVNHPLQPYDARNFEHGGLVDGERFSFDRAGLEGALAAAGDRHAPPPLLPGPLPPREHDDVGLDDLKAFLSHPVRTFLRARLDVSVPLEADELGDAIPISLDSLEQWQVGDHLLRCLLAGDEPEAVMLAEQLRGRLPPGRLGEGSLTKVVEECTRLWERTAHLREQPGRAIDVDVDLGDGRRLTGTVTGIHGSRLVSLGYSRLKPRQRLNSWVDLLALSAAQPDGHFTAHAVGRERAGPKVAIAGPVDHTAVEHLRTLVGLRDLGLTAPMAAPLATANAWSEAHAKELTGHDADPVVAAERQWVTDQYNAYGIKGDDADPYHQRVYGPDAPIDKLLADGLAEHAWAIWQPLLSGGEKVQPL